VLGVKHKHRFKKTSSYSWPHPSYIPSLIIFSWEYVNLAWELLERCVVSEFGLSISNVFVGTIEFLANQLKTK
jgi:hypothetical protein